MNHCHVFWHARHNGLILFLLEYSHFHEPHPLLICTWFLKNQVRQTGFLACKNRFRNWFLQATQAVKTKFELKKNQVWFEIDFFFQVCNKLPNWNFKNQELIDKTLVRLKSKCIWSKIKILILYKDYLLH